MSPSNNPVLIVGAGPVGLSAAIELARHGVRSVVFEKHPTTSWHPKTRNFNTRTMEIARGWGLGPYQRLRHIDTPPGWKSPILFTDSATGTEYGRIESKGFEGPGAEVSPAEPIMSAQDLIEEILFDTARASGLVDLRFSTEMVGLVRGGDDRDTDVAIEVRTVTNGATSQVVGSALIAADGAGSFIRSALGIEMVGRQNVSNLVNCYFRADIEPHLQGRTGVLFFVANERATGVLQPLDARGRWLCQITVSPEDWSLDTFTHARAAQWVRDAVGIDTLDVDVLSIGLWKLNATVADRFVSGRTLLCGDAAHQFPPTGGLGVNTGLQGMHNAMWKLAWYVNGDADWSLVQTYETERRPVSQRITDQSFQNSVNVARIRAAIANPDSNTMTPEQITTEARRYGNHLGVEFGSVYSSPLVFSDGTTPPAVADDYSDYLPSATPGARFPHHWLGTPNSRLSTLDLIGAGLTLFAGPDGAAWRAVGDAASLVDGVRVATYVIGSAGLDDLGDFCRIVGIKPDGAVLVRPDGHVVWRSVTGPTNEHQLVAVVAAMTGNVGR